MVAALVLVPAIARAHQRVEHRDATRLSIKHNWLGVAPPTKATIAPRQVIVAPSIDPQPEPYVLSRRAVIAPAHSLHPVPELSPDPLRGPPALRLS